MSTPDHLAQGGRPWGAEGGEGHGEPPLVYLDYAATAPPLPEVLEAMAPFFAGRFGNASGSHRMARDAKRALEEARDQVAELVGAAPSEVIFTAGGTESDNLAILGTMTARAQRAPGPPAVVCSAIEHAAVLESCEAARRLSVGPEPPELRVLPARPDGTVDLEALEDLLGPEVALVSVMTANNEVGTLQPLAQLAAAVQRHCPDAAVHTDAVQAAPWLDLASATAPAHLVSLSAHKCGGPKGAGVLVAREGAALAPMVYGGGQERRRRAGTEDVAGAVGTAAALATVAARRQGDAARVRALRDLLADGLVAGIEGVTECAPRHLVLPGHCNVRFDGVDQEDLLVLLDQAGVCASAGSACASGALDPSHVLVAMGLSPTQARSAVRFTLGHATSHEEVERALAVVAHAVDRLRA